MRAPKGVVILGSTGSIGTQTLDVIRTYPDCFKVVGLAARRSIDLLERQTKEFLPRLVWCEEKNQDIERLIAYGSTECPIESMVADPDVDLVVTATVGDVALKPTLDAIESGKDIALGNKESVVMAGEKLTSYARQHGVSILPVDSEPNAIWQCMRGEEKEVSKLIITASGGAFRNAKLGELATVTPEQALRHPNWTMGPKITVDAATLMNKAFEVIEARWLFDVGWDQIEVVIHHQSIIHSMVEFVDGSVKAQISPPDMRLPIQYALFYPDRVYNENIRQFDPVSTGSLTFEAWDSERYPCFKMALNIAKKGGTWPAALCGADERAVDVFLSGKIGFLDIGPVIEESLAGHSSIEDPSTDDMIAAAQWAKDSVTRVVEG